MYRVRHARVEVCNGERCWRERRFGAERRVSLFGLVSWWWPVEGAEWRRTAHAARIDAERDAAMREPLAPDEVFTITREPVLIMPVGDKGPEIVAAETGERAQSRGC